MRRTRLQSLKLSLREKQTTWKRIPHPSQRDRTKMGLLTYAIGATAMAAGGATTVIAAPLILGAVGFTGAGIAASSFASSMMSAAAVANGGGVVAGSVVAVLQSAGAAGIPLAAQTVIGAVGSGAGGVLAAILI
ncbi:interferon alpha-inducible protein 27-like protein 2A [Triplophysa dalaica]|uniref:interferon alpha-inducible protein 27-like protein 2A n=1 Tax=Triplophysa dalaica TaxID=1582913 RepID=UPI0024DF820F|nr:interferon alpha-inducible protein 27-like protein 2A [Triplophysa dalaica]XP_056617116.1 interferon alpha-inducible protein 27-like protein 2A [Triplophysa dalaica]